MKSLSPLGGNRKGGSFSHPKTGKGGLFSQKQERGDDPRNMKEDQFSILMETH